MSYHISEQKQAALSQYVEKSLKEFSCGETKNYSRLVHELNFQRAKQQLSVSAFNWFQTIGLCARQLNLSLHRELVSVILNFQWGYPEPVLQKYSELLLRLITADGSFTKPVLEAVVPQLTIKRILKNEEIVQKILDSEKHQLKITMIEKFLRQSKISRPNISTTLFPELIRVFPHRESPPICFRAYLISLFRILEDFHDLRYRCLQFLLEKVVAQDLLLLKLEKLRNRKPKQYNEKYQNCLEILDVLVSMILAQLQTMVEQNNEELPKMWTFVMNCFERNVLKAGKSRHVQFILLYLCQFQSEFAHGFLEQLVNISTHPSTPAMVRIASFRYAAGFVVRANYMKLSSIRWCVAILLKWALQYVRVFQRRYPHKKDVLYHETESHETFYAALQSVFFISINRPEIFQESESIEDDLISVLNSPLVPLKYCGQNLVQPFLQNIDHVREFLPDEINCSNVPEVEFPFEIFLLDQSKAFFIDVYNTNTYQDSAQDESNDSMDLSS